MGSVLKLTFISTILLQTLAAFSALILNRITKSATVCCGGDVIVLQAFPFTWFSEATTIKFSLSPTTIWQPMQIG